MLIPIMQLFCVKFSLEIFRTANWSFTVLEMNGENILISTSIKMVYDIYLFI